jgi:hypothetical protein
MNNLPNMTDNVTPITGRLPQRPTKNSYIVSLEGYTKGFTVSVVGLVWIFSVQNICTKWKGFK